MCNNNCNNNCNSQTNPCGCGTSTNDVIYNGPTLSCTNVNTCDTLTDAISSIGQFLCSVELVQLVINNITNNINLYNQFTTIVNNTVDCQTVWNCINATTTTTTTNPLYSCESFSLTNTGVDPVGIIITNCITGEQEAVVLLPGDTNICVQTDSPLTVPGTVIVTPEGPCGPTTSTTTTIAPTTTTTTTAIPCECLTFNNTSATTMTYNYTNCEGVEVGPLNILGKEVINVCGCCGFASDPKVLISVGENCIDGACPTTTTTTTVEVMCMEISIDASTNCPDQDYALVQYTDCEGNIQTVETNSGELLTFCMLNYPPPVYLCGTGGFQYGDVCTTTTTTTYGGPGYLKQFGAANETGAGACLEVAGAITLYTNTPTITFSTLYYIDGALTTPFNGGLLWYKDISGISSVRISSTGTTYGMHLC